MTFNEADFDGKNWILAEGDKAQFDVKKGSPFSGYGTVPRMTSNATGSNRKVDSWKENKSDKVAFDPDAAVTKDLTLHPASAKNYWTVTFDYAGGTGEPASTTVVDGQTVSAPADPTRLSNSKRYEFAGWKNGETAYDFSTPVTGNLTLTASWNVTAVKVTFVPNYGSELPTEMWIEDGDKLVAPELEREGYQLTGWTTGEDGTDVSATETTAYAAAQGYPLHINESGNLYYIVSNGTDGVYDPTTGALPTTFYAQ